MDYHDEEPYAYPTSIDSDRPNADFRKQVVKSKARHSSLRIAASNLSKRFHRFSLTRQRSVTSDPDNGDNQDNHCWSGSPSQVALAGMTSSTKVKFLSPQGLNLVHQRSSESHDSTTSGVSMTSSNYSGTSYADSCQSYGYPYHVSASAPVGFSYYNTG